MAAITELAEHSTTPSAASSAGDALLAQLLQEAASLENEVIAWRRHLHMHPELSFHEHNTAQFVFDTLSAFPALELSRPTKTSVVAKLFGAEAGPTIAVRADMDALPITEETDLPFKSRAEGVMHACGHDGHTAILLGLAKLLSSHREHLRGEVRFIFQHAEELFPGGAQELVDVGVVDGVDQIIGLHLIVPIPVGLVALIPGPAMAAPDTFRCTITGRGGHAAMPHQTVDPIVVGAEVVTALQQIVARNIDPLDNAVVSVTQFNSGTAFNVIPESAVLMGTVRTFDPVLRDKIPELMERTVAGITSAHGATYKFEMERGYRALVNDPALTARLTGVAQQTFGTQAVFPVRPVMGGEDFSAYQTKAPGVFAFIGAYNSKMQPYPHHHPRFHIDEASLAIGLRFLTAATLELMS